MTGTEHVCSIQGRAPLPYHRGGGTPAMRGAAPCTRHRFRPSRNFGPGSAHRPGLSRCLDHRRFSWFCQFLPAVFLPISLADSFFKTMLPFLLCKTMLPIQTERNFISHRITGCSLRLESMDTDSFKMVTDFSSQFVHDDLHLSRLAVRQAARYTIRSQAGRKK
jgi:hypothetical protein